MGDKPRTNLSEYDRKLIRYKARQLVGQFGFNVSDLEDIEQNLLLHVLERMERFDPQRGCEHTFVARVVSHKIVSIIRHRCAARRHWGRVEHSLDALAEHGSGCSVLSESPNDELADMTIDVRSACAALDDDLRRLTELLQSHSLAEAARKLGLTRGDARGRVNRLRRQWKEIGMDEYVDE